MINEIVKKLNADFPQVKAVRFGDSRPAAPYAVVKRESGINGVNFRIIAHFKPGQQIFLDDYIRGTVGNSLDDFNSANRHGSRNRLYAEEIPSDVTISNDDGTISAERLYSMPDRVF